MQKVIKWVALTLAAFVVVALAIALFSKSLVEFGASHALGREVEIGGDFDIDFSRPLRVRAEQVSIANPAWSEQAHLLEAAALIFSIDLRALWEGRVVLPELKLVAPTLVLEKSAQGQGNWEFSGRGEPAPGNQEAAESPGQTSGPITDQAAEQRAGKLPVVEHWSIDDASIVYRDKTRGKTIEAFLDTAEGNITYNKPVALAANGRFGKQPFTLKASAGSLAMLAAHREPSQQNAPVAAAPPDAYPVRMHLTAGATRAHIEGAITDPLRLGGMNLTLALEGPDSAELFPLLGIPVPAAQPFSLKGRLTKSGETWRLADLQGNVGNSGLHGDIAVDLSAARPSIKADLASDRLDFGLLAGWFDAAPRDQDEIVSAPRQPFNAEKLNAVNAQVSFRAKQIIGTKLPLDNAVIDVSLEDGHLSVNPFKLGIGGGQLGAQLTLDAAQPEVAGELAMQFDDVPLDPLFDPFHPRYPVAGIVDGNFALAFSGNDAGLASGRVGYRHPQTKTDLVFTLNRERQEQEWALKVQGEGRFHGEPASVVFSGQPFVLLADPDAQIPLAMKLALAKTEFAGDGSVARRGQQFDLNASISGPGTERLERIIGVDLPELPRYHASGRVVRNDDVIEIENLKGKIGASDLSGRLLVNTSGQRPFIKADLKSGTIAYADFDQLRQKSDEPFDWDKLRKVDADVKIAAQRVVVPEDLVLENVRVDAALQNGLLKLKPLRFDVGGGEVALDLALDADRKKLLQGAIHADVAKVDLGEALKPFGLDKRFSGLLDADLDLALGQGARAGNNKQMTGESRAHYREAQSGNDVRFVISQQPDRTGIKGEGKFQNEPFRLAATIGPLARILSPEPYPLDIDIGMLETTARIHGAVSDPINATALDLALEIAGPNPQRLDPILGFSLPDLPPYRLRGDLSKRADLWQFANFKGTVGDSDLAGRMAVDVSGAKPHISATLDSQLLDFDDLAGLIGAAPSADPGETVSETQRKKGAQQRASDRTLPVETLNFSRLSRFNADVNYHAGQVKSDNLPIDDMTIDFALREGQLVFKPLEFGAAGGDIRLHITLDGVSQPPAGKIEAEVAHLKLAPILKNYEVSENSLGVVGGRATLWVTGNSIAEMLASVDGGAFLLMGGGKLDALLVELAGLDGGESLLRWLGEKQTVDIRCAIADLKANDGKVDIVRGVIDSTDTRFDVAGSINFNGERLNVIIKPEPKDVSFFVARAPLIIEGSFKNPDFHPSTGNLIARGGAALALAAIFPPAALLALVEPGLGDDAPCAAFQDTFKELR